MDFCIIKYEDLLQNPAQEFQRLSDHCGFQQVPIQDCLRAMEKDSQRGSMLARDTLKKFRKSEEFTQDEIREMNEILLKLDLPTLSEFRL